MWKFIESSLLPLRDKFKPDEKVVQTAEALSTWWFTSISHA